MAISPGIYNFKIRRRSDHTELFQICDESGSGVDLTGWEVKAQAWLEGRTKKLFDFSVDTSHINEGFAEIAVSSAVTTGLPRQFEYDVLLIDPWEFKRHFFVAGTISVDEGYTT